MKTSSIFFAAVLTASANLNAEIIYDEAIDGDTARWWLSSTSAQLGLVKNGDIVKGYTAYDYSSNKTHWDGYEFTLDGSIDKISFETEGDRFNKWQLYNASNTVLDDSDYTTNIFDFNVAGLIGTFKLGNNRFRVLRNDPGYSYTITFGDVKAVPVPASAFLIAPALLGFIGLRRKSQS
jgi:hypothetical protein